jgi:methionyl-tRNA synthetase
MEFADTFGADALRYFLIREMNVGQDSDFTVELFLSRYNADLANNLGNLVSRLLNMTGKSFSEGLPAPTISEEPEIELRKQWDEARVAIEQSYDGFQFHQALERTIGFITSINRYAETRAPWKLAKSSDPKDQERYATALAVMAEGLRLGVAFLKPVMPEVSDKIYHLLGQSPIDSWDNLLDWSACLTGVKLGEKTILFPRPKIEVAEEN